jgi:hypothetical protein
MLVYHTQEPRMVFHVMPHIGGSVLVNPTYSPYDMMDEKVQVELEAKDFLKRISLPHIRGRIPKFIHFQDRANHADYVLSTGAKQRALILFSKGNIKIVDNIDDISQETLDEIIQHFPDLQQLK